MKRVWSISTIILITVSLISFATPAFALEIERPGGYLILNERDQNATTNGKASVGLGVDVYTYHEDEPGWPSWGNDYAKLHIVATGNSRKILEYGCSSSQYHWYDTFITEQWTCLGDEEILYIDLPFKVRFYGGPGSAEYTEVWVT